MTAEEIDEQITKLIVERDALTERIEELRRTRPAETVQNYLFHTSDGEPKALAELFGDKSDLLVIHNMGKGCSYCTLWADGFNGFVDHLESRSAFVVISPDAPEVQREFADGRGWRFKMASAAGTTFIADMGFEMETNDFWPGVSAFHKNEDGSIERVGRDYLGPGDVYCSVWHLFGLLKDGVGDWEPRFHY